MHARTHKVVVEEDLVFSPDLLLFFARLAPAMDADDSILAISAYNDNGLAPIASNTCLVYRSHWFPGLGWLASRKIFTVELLPRWPSTHWYSFVIGTHVWYFGTRL
jgi:alpha-1,3-mannosyl-glycoprotein beta-1,2-N-acetylglucosaminyltransferase